MEAAAKVLLRVPRGKRGVQRLVSAAKVVRDFAKSREKVSGKEKPTAPSVPRRSPIQVLTGLNAA